MSEIDAGWQPTALAQALTGWMDHTGRTARYETGGAARGRVQH